MVTGLQDSNCWGLEGWEYLDVSISMWCVHLAFLAWRLQDSWNSYTMDLCSKVSLPRETQTQTERQNLSTSSNLASEVTYVTSTVFYLLGQPEMPAKTQGENTYTLFPWWEDSGRTCGTRIIVVAMLGEYNPPHWVLTNISGLQFVLDVKHWGTSRLKVRIEMVWGTPSWKIRISLRPSQKGVRNSEPGITAVKISKVFQTLPLPLLLPLLSTLGLDFRRNKEEY